MFYQMPNEISVNVEIFQTRKEKRTWMARKLDFPKIALYRKEEERVSKNVNFNGWNTWLIFLSYVVWSIYLQGM